MPLENYLSESFNKKVDKEAGKGLSVNGYTIDEKEKLAGIEVGATINAPYISKPGMDGTAFSGNFAH